MFKSKKNPTPKKEKPPKPVKEKKPKKVKEPKEPKQKKVKTLAQDLDSKDSLGTWLRELYDRYRNAPKDLSYYDMRLQTSQFLFLVMSLIFFLVFLFVVGGLTLPGLGIDRRDMAVILFVLYPTFLLCVFLFVYTLIDYLIFKHFAKRIYGKIIGILLGIIYLVSLFIHLGVFQEFAYSLIEKFS